MGLVLHDHPHSSNGIILGDKLQLFVGILDLPLTRSNLLSACASFLPVLQDRLAISRI